MISKDQQPILLIDNYDSFAHNLARYFIRLGQSTVVLRNDEIDEADVQSLGPAAIVLSPGPCTPAVAGNSLAIVQAWHTQLPMLGVCLGHQTIAVALGASLRRSPEPVHGRTSRITHDGKGIFTDLENPFSACRYHSLGVDEPTLPPTVEVSARTEDNLMMAMRHRELPLVGLQFHPESILTPFGYPLLAAFLKTAGLTVCEPIPTIDEETFSGRKKLLAPRLQQPITF